VDRIDTLDGPIPAAVRGANAAQQRAIGFAIAELMVDRFPDLPGEFRAAVEAARANAFGRDAHDRLSAAADQLDETYLDMQDDEKPGGRTLGWEHAASLARASFAIRDALSDDARRAAVESTYEAVCALDDDDVILRTVEAAKHVTFTDAD
jgi:hypothetical protein